MDRSAIGSLAATVGFLSAAWLWDHTPWTLVLGFSLLIPATIWHVVETRRLILAQARAGAPRSPYTSSEAPGRAKAEAALAEADTYDALERRRRIRSNRWGMGLFGVVLATPLLAPAVWLARLDLFAIGAVVAALTASIGIYLGSEPREPDGARPPSLSARLRRRLGSGRGAEPPTASTRLPPR